MLGGIVLVTLNMLNYYIGGHLNSAQPDHDTERLAGLQFGAKIHELLLLASIGTILWTYIRRSLLRHGSDSENGLPFGSMFAGLGIDSINFLWSLEFWSVVVNKQYKGLKKWRLVFAIFVCCIFGASIGPASAIVSIVHFKPEQRLIYIVDDTST